MQAGGKDKDPGKGHDNKVPITVIVNGTPTEVEANLNAPLKTIIPKALEQTSNTGQPVENWELRDSAGIELPLETKIRDLNFPPGVQLFLNLKAGVGG